MQSAWARFNSNYPTTSFYLPQPHVRSGEPQAAGGEFDPRTSGQDDEWISSYFLNMCCHLNGPIASTCVPTGLLVYIVSAQVRIGHIGEIQFYSTGCLPKLQLLSIIYIYIYIHISG